jgi:DNA-binding transcriptional LysR family regulator
MDISNLMILFVRTVEQGSFSAAARALSRSPSAVSRQIAALEDHLGVRLLNRSSRRVTLTEEGRTFHERCLRIVAEIDDVQAQMAHMAQHVQGTLRVTATVAFAKAHLLPLFPEFLKLYPELALHLELTDRLVDLAEEGVDVAIRFTEQVEDESLVARRLVHNRRVVVAAPSYLALHGTPRVPEDLLAHNCLRMYSVSSFNDWEFARCPRTPTRRPTSWPSTRIGGTCPPRCARSWTFSPSTCPTHRTGSRYPRHPAFT